MRRAKLENLPKLPPLDVRAEHPREWYLDKAKALAYIYFEEDDQPVMLTDGQAEIFAEIYFQLHSRVQVICCTQYGKSWTIGLATTLAAIATREAWIIVAPTDSKAAITMGKVLTHVFDNDQISCQLMRKKETLARLKDEKSKKKISFLHGGSIETITLNAINSKRKNEAAMGHGAPNIILDEASLIDDELESSVSRMVGGYAHRGRTFIMKVGNPFYRNHFLKSWQGNIYYKIFIDYKRALKEGRFTESFIEEMRPKPFFDIYYKCKFPEQTEVDDKGFRYLITDEEFDAAIVPDHKIPNLRGGRVGIDIAAGGDDNSFVARKGKFAKIYKKNKAKDTMTQVSEIRRIRDDLQLEMRKIAMDDSSVGRGIYDRCQELDDVKEIEGIGFGSKAPEEDENREKHKNMRAFMYWKLGVWIKAGGKLPESQREQFKDLLEVKYKLTSDDKILFEEKKEIKKRIGHSPDDCDALALTFTPLTPEPTLSFS